MSAQRYRLFPQAHKDVRDLAQHIGRDNAGAADKFLDAIEVTCDRLVAFPESGVSRTFSDSELVNL